MELGSTICTPRAPDCPQCPVAAFCPPGHAGCRIAIPHPKRKTIYVAVHEAAVVVRRADGGVLLRRCGADERWAGLWDFPRFETVRPDDAAGHPGTAPQSGRADGLDDPFRRRFATIKYGVTRFRITLVLLSGHLPSSRAGRATTCGGSRLPRSRPIR